MKKPDNSELQVVDTLSREVIGDWFDIDFGNEFDNPYPCVSTIPAIVLRGDLVIEGDLRTSAFLNEIAMPDQIDQERTLERFHIVVLGNLVVEGHLVVDQYYNLYVRGKVSAQSYRSHSADFISAEIVVKEIVLTEQNEEGGYFGPKLAKARMWVMTNQYYFNDVPFEGLKVDADSLNGEHTEQTMCAVYSALDRPYQDESLWFPLNECLEAGKLQAFFDAFQKDKRPKPNGVPDDARFENGYYELSEHDSAGRLHGYRTRWSVDGRLRSKEEFHHGETSKKRIEKKSKRKVIEGVAKKVLRRLKRSQTTQQDN